MFRSAFTFTSTHTVIFLVNLFLEQARWVGKLQESMSLRVFFDTFIHNQKHTYLIWYTHSFFSWKIQQNTNTIFSANTYQTNFKFSPCSMVIRHSYRINSHWKVGICKIAFFSTGIWRWLYFENRVTFFTISILLRIHITLTRMISIC